MLQGILKKNEDGDGYYYENYEDKKRDYVEYVKLNDHKNVYFYIEEKDVKFNNTVKVINYKKYKKVYINDVPEIIYFLKNDNNIVTYLYNLNYDIRCYFRYYFNNFVESVSGALITY